MQNQELKLTKKIDDLGEHLRQIRSEIEVENSTLNRLKAERVEKEKALDARESEITRREGELSTRLRLVMAAENEIADREYALKKDSDELESLRKETAAEFAKKSQELETKAQESEALVLSNQMKINNGLIELERQEGEYAKKFVHFTELNARLEKELSDNALESTRMAQDIEELSDTIKAKKNELSAIYAEIDEAKKINQEEGGKIKLAHEGLEERERDLATRERNYLILKERLTRLFYKLYPENNINKIL